MELAFHLEDSASFRAFAVFLCMDTKEVGAATDDQSISAASWEAINARW